MVVAGEYDSIQEACDHILKIDKIVEPDERTVKQYEMCYEFYRSLYPQMKESFAVHKKLVDNLGI